MSRFLQYSPQYPSDETEIFRMFLVRKQSSSIENRYEKNYSKRLFDALQLQVNQSMVYTSAIKKHLPIYSHTQNLQNIQYTQLPKQIPNIPNGVCVMQQTGKSETTFNLRLNNHWKDVNKRNSLQADRHFRRPVHNFNKHAKFTLTEHLNHSW